MHLTLRKDGQFGPTSIACLEKVNLGGVDHWLILRSLSGHKPVILFLAGGSRVSEARYTPRFHQEPKNTGQLLSESSEAEVNPPDHLTRGKHHLKTSYFSPRLADVTGKILFYDVKTT